jgi:DNA polymerase-3 subunit beta
MKMTVETKKLRDALSAVAPAMPRNSIVPALSCARLRLLPKQSGDQDYPQVLEVCCAGLDARIAVEIPCRSNGSRKQDLLLPLKTALALVKLFDQRETQISRLSKTAIRIVAGDCEYSFNTPDPDDFPERMVSADPRASEDAEIKPKPDQSVKFAGNELVSMLRGARYAASDGSDNRYVLQSVLFEFDADILRLISTDGRRLAIVERKLDKAVAASGQYIVPVAAADMLTRALAAQVQENGAVGLGLTSDHVVVTCVECHDIEGLEFRAKLIDGAYPNYRQVIEGLESTARVSVDRTDFLRAIQRISLIAQDPSAFGMDLDLDETLTIQSVDRRATEHLAALSFSGEKTELRLNPRYVLDFLNAVDDETIHLQVGRGYDPICLADGENRRLCYIAPMRSLS